jgi:signal transduction histidine kinase
MILTERSLPMEKTSQSNQELLDEIRLLKQRIQLLEEEKANRADELVIANKELHLQNQEKDKRAEELILANEEKENRAAELAIANKELAFQNEEKDKRADELALANKELAFQSEEKDKRADELALANKELAFQNEEKDKRADELSLANEEKDKRAEELILANEEKENRAAELAIANKELHFQNQEKAKRADELVIADKEKQLLELQLQRAQRLESLGVLSGGIAHDFNNILAIIVGYCGLTKRNYESAKKHIPQIEIAAERAALLCRQMMAYAGKAQLTISDVDIVIQIKATVDLLKSTLPKNVVIISELSANTPMIKGDPGQLHQVVMNLIINASEAIGIEQGEINVSLAKFDVIEGLSFADHLGESISPGEYICLEVTDNGCGMDEETKWKLFEPFFTTKFVGRGLGMSAVLGIINSHGGALQVFSQLGQGTAFKVYLPALVGELSGRSDEGPSTAEATWQGCGTILLVEDEEPVRDIAKERLEILGFTVLEAVNGKEALELYQMNAENITLVLTDMGMPVMDGYELFDALKKLNPELPIIISSGYGDVEVTSRIRSDEIAAIITKPYNLDKLREVLKRVAEG